MATHNNHKTQAIKTRYEQTIADFPNNIDFSKSNQLTDLVILAESRSISGTELTQQPANEYRFALNNYQIEIDIDNCRINISNTLYGNTNSITNIKCYNHIKFQSKFIDYETIHFDVYTKGRFKLSAELTKLLIELITKIQAGNKYNNINYDTSGLTTQITQ